MVKNKCSDLYYLVQVINEQNQNGVFNLNEIKPLLNNDMSIKRVPKNEIIHPGEIDVDYACYIIRGSFFKYRIEKKGGINFLSKEKAPTWSCLDKILDPEHSNFVEAKALEECTVLYVKRDYIIRCLEENSRFVLGMLKDMLTLTSTMSMKSDRLLFNDAKEHLLFYILEYWNRTNKGEKRCRIEMKNDYIAAELGVNVRTIYRTKKVLEDEGLITLEKGKIFVKQEQIEQIKLKLYN